MRFAREGLPFITGSVVVTFLGLWVAVNRGGPWWALAIVVLVIAGWVAYFFRDPERSGDRGEHLVVAPADGKVVLITEVDEPAFIGGRALRVSIFMNVFSVHVNRYPVSGTVRHVRVTPGKFLNAVGREGEQVVQGERMGLIRFGSRVDVFVPPASTLCARLGDLTSAGTSVVAELPG